jgi:uncharacterized protein YbjT (DUF2867 family)
VTSAEDFSQFAGFERRKRHHWRVRILVTGASGFVGSALARHLLSVGQRPRVLVRDATRFRKAIASARSYGGHHAASSDDPSGAEAEIVIGDVLTGSNLPLALAGVEVAYYLIHSMEPAYGETFSAREQRAAENFANAARAAGVRRIVYLGGPLPAGVVPSPHLASRHAVERTLMQAIPDSVALRASIVIGARSRSFRFLVRLIERMPVIALPAWRRFRTQPIDERDVVEMLVAAASSRAVGGRSLDIGGLEVLTYGEVVERIADLMMLGRPTVGLAVSATPLAARLAAVLTDETPDLVLPLMESLCGDLLASDDAAELLRVNLHSFDAAVEHALRDWEATERLAAR